MKGYRTKSFQVFLIALLTVTVGFFGCQKEMPLTPESNLQNTHSTNQLTFLSSKSMRLEKAFSSQELITVAAGGTMTAGDDSSGYSSLFFKPGDLSNDATITFNGDSQGYITDLDPHGISFNTPVEIYLSYKDADLTQVNEDSLHIWYYNDNTTNWELVGGTVNKVDKRVEGFINHFSRYAVASE